MKFLRGIILVTCLILQTSCFEKPATADTQNSSEEDSLEVRNEKQTTTSKASAASKVEPVKSDAVLEKELESAKKRLGSLEPRKKKLEETLAKALGTSSSTSPVVVKAEAYLSKLKEADEYYDAELDLWKTATRKSFEGIRLKQIVTSDGKTYQNIIIKRVTDGLLLVEKDDGEKVTIPTATLDGKLRMNLIDEDTVAGRKHQPTNYCF